MRVLLLLHFENQIEFHEYVDTECFPEIGDKFYYKKRIFHVIDSYWAESFLGDNKSITKTFTLKERVLKSPYIYPENYKPQKLED